MSRRHLYCTVLCGLIFYILFAVPIYVASPCQKPHPARQHVKLTKTIWKRLGTFRFAFRLSSNQIINRVARDLAQSESRLAELKRDAFQCVQVQYKVQPATWLV